MHFLSFPQSERRLVRGGYDLKGLEMHDTKEANQQGKKGDGMPLLLSSPAFAEQKGKKKKETGVNFSFYFPLIRRIDGSIKVT